MFYILARYFLSLGIYELYYDEFFNAGPSNIGCYNFSMPVFGSDSVSTDVCMLLVCFC